MQPPPPGPHLSPNGKWWWNGAQWLPTGQGVTAGSAAKAGFFAFFGAQCAACLLACVAFVVVIGVPLASCSAVARGVQSVPTGQPAPFVRALREDLDRGSVLLEADSEADLRSTHGSFFLTPDELAERLQPAV